MFGIIIGGIWGLGFDVVKELVSNGYSYLIFIYNVNIECVE